MLLELFKVLIRKNILVLKFKKEVNILVKIYVTVKFIIMNETFCKVLVFFESSLSCPMSNIEYWKQSSI